MTNVIKGCGSTLSVFYLNKVSQSELWLFFYLQINLKQCEKVERHERQSAVRNNHRQQSDEPKDCPSD
ncbi:unnamed protein product [Clavelina lepadiformis]|uniref:Uncharacterized protein n=1 Tax=Clavelina lepadiformis TaxID=159417 RepID=A0ABP0FFR7_CLALP